ncbi:MAG: polysaccharide biosynthesis/export protein VpsN, partial [Candidatus Hydrogenedentes bacterium]|nr:polysaccharide biosynthesis/export protein VpsN [Candidatus Hydrogenedentota bacterium]
MFPFRRIPLFSLLVATFALAAGCATRPATPAIPEIPETGSTAQLRPGDSLNIALQGVPDPTSNTVQIDDQGLISLPYIGTVLAAGSTIAEVSQLIRETYVSRKIYTTVD